MSNRSTPIVPHVLYVAEQHHPWRLAAYERLRTRYHTPTTVAVEFGTIDLTVQPVRGKTGVSKQQTHVYCLADEDAWSKVQQERGALQAHLDALAAGLRDLGGYAKRLEEAGGRKKAPNPLSPTVIHAPDPDLTKDGYFINNPVPRLSREQITDHTPKMLHIEQDGRPWSTSHQRDHFVCPDNAAWERIQALVGAVQRAADAWKQLLQELGSYHSALADKRYARKETPPVATTPAPTAPPAEGWHTLPPALALWTKHKNVKTNELSLIAPDGWSTKEYRSSDKAIAEALRRVNSQPKSTAIEPVPTGALSTALQDCARRYVAAREAAGDALLDMAEAISQARALAQHGEWYAFLEAIGTSQDQADRLIDIHEQAERNPAFAEAIRRNFLNPTTAALLARPSTPPAVVEAVLSAPTPPTKRQVEQQIQEARGVESKSRTGAGFALPSDLAGAGLYVADIGNDYVQIRGTVGMLAGWRGNGKLARHLDTLIVEARIEIDNLHIRAARKILAGVSAWSEPEQARLYQEAYGHARQVRDRIKYDALFAEIDAALDGAKPTAPTRPAREGDIAPPGLPAGWSVRSRAGADDVTTWYRAIGPNGVKTGEHKSADGAAQAARALAGDPPTMQMATALEGEFGIPVEAEVIGADVLPPAPVPVARDLVFACERCGKDATQRINVAGVMEHRCAACGTLPIRPARPPRDPGEAGAGDVSVLLDYVADLEDYATALEQAIERSGEYGAVPTLQEVGA